MQKPMEPPDKEGAVAFLSAYVDQMEDLLEILSRGPLMSQSDKFQATEMYRSLKSGLKEDCKRLSRKESQGEATHMEIAFLLPAVLNASASLRPATNTNPVASRWSDAVYCARTDISCVLDQLKK